MGGGILNFQTLTLINVTITGNRSSGEGGGIFNRMGGTVSATNAIIADNLSGGDCSGDGLTTLGRSQEQSSSMTSLRRILIILSVGPSAILADLHITGRRQKHVAPIGHLRYSLSYGARDHFRPS